MENNLVTDLYTCMPSLMSVLDGNLNLLYYSHIPTIIISLIFGFFVLIRGGRKLLPVIFFFLALSFAVWSVLDLFTWLSSDTRVIMFTWSVTGIIEALFFLLSFYFVYVFIEKKDISLGYKIVGLISLLPLIIMVPTNFNLAGFDIDGCYSLESAQSLYYKYSIEVILSILVILFFSIKIKQSHGERRRQLLILFSGVILFLLSFFSAIFVSGYLVDNGFGVKGYNIEIYGLFGTTIFMGVLGYMIVEFKAFNIKLIGAQALVVSLIILIASQFAFIQNPTNKVLNGIALILITGFGYILIRSVKREIAQREALALANNEIGERKDQLQKISDHLAVANARLKELDTAKSEFVSIVAHQLQGPPTTVKGYSMLLSDGSYGEMNVEQKDILQKIYNANEQQIEFVNDLLNVSRMESGRVSFAFEKCSVIDICREVIDNLFIKAKDKNLYLEYRKTDNNIPAVNVDKAKIREAITNLIDNAIKYTKKGGVTLAIKVCSGTTKCLAGNHIRIVIADTGIGVPQSEMIHLFSKFSRGKDVKRLNAGGTGLGLYVVKMIVEGNHGHVWIESEGEGKGSRFIIELPVG